MKESLLALLLGLSVSTAAPAEGAFSLLVPESRIEAFRGESIVLAGDPPASVVIQIDAPLASRLLSSRLFPRVNGMAAATVSRTTRVGQSTRLEIALDRSSDVRLRSSVLNSIEIVAEDKEGNRYEQSWSLRFGDHDDHPFFDFEFFTTSKVRNPVAPDVRVLAPLTPPRRVPGEARRVVSVEATVSSPFPLKSVRVQDVEILGTPGVFDFEVVSSAMTLPGQLSFTIEAIDIHGNRTRVSIPIEDVAPSRPLRLAGRKHAVIVGVSDFESEGLSTFPMADSHARRLSESLTSHAGFSPEAVHLLVGSDATTERVLDRLGSVIAATQPDDLLLVYFATLAFEGEGSTLKRWPPESDVYLAGFDTLRDRAAATSVSASRLADLLSGDRESLMPNIIAIFDVAAREGSKAGDTSAVLPRLSQLGDSQQRRLSLARFSSRGPAGGAAFSGAKTFTEILLEGIAGAGDLNGDFVVTIDELLAFSVNRIGVLSDSSTGLSVSVPAGEQGLLTLSGKDE